MYVLGVDGCKAGLFAIGLSDDTAWKMDIFQNIFCLWDTHKSASLILIDTPIGLREKGDRERFCDIEARKILGRKRASGVFPAPCRASLVAQSYTEACDLNKSMTGRRLSCQTWNILSKISEVDGLHKVSEQARAKLREIHPEICF